MTYATDGKCHNAGSGTYGDECGKPAQWVGTTESGYAAGFCDRCKIAGWDARDVRVWTRRADYVAA